MEADPRVKVETYLETNKVPQLLETLTAQLLFHKPENPRDFICNYLEQVKVTGTATLLTEQDLDTMFGMFDLTKRGVLTAEQANNALKVILGPAADLSEVGVKPGSSLTKEQFVTSMSAALKRSVPYKA